MRRWGAGILVTVIASLAFAPGPAAGDPVVVVPGATGEARPDAESVAREHEPSALAVRVRAALEDVEVAGAEGARTLSITPNSGLVDRQEVSLHGEGWPARAELFVIQCGPAPLDPAACEYSELDDDGGVIRTGPLGGFTAIRPVEVILDAEDGAIDCRVVTCRMVVIADDGDARRFAPLDFDPGGPDPDRYPVTVTPDTGLLDGQELTVTGSGFPLLFGRFGYAYLLPCRTPVLSAADCEGSLVDYVELTDDGSFDTKVVANAVLDLEIGPHDCRSAPCALLVGPESFSFGELGEISEAGLAPHAFDPGGALRPPPVLTVDPATDLLDGDTVELHGTGFLPSRDLEVLQCTAGATSSDDCTWGAFFFGDVDDAGEFDFVFGVMAVFRNGRGEVVDCREVACSLIAAHGSFGRHAEAPLDFVPGGELLVPSITVTPSTGLHPGDGVWVRGTNWVYGVPVEVGQCPAGVTGMSDCEPDFIGIAYPGEEGIFFRPDERVGVPLARTEGELERGESFVIDMPALIEIWSGKVGGFTNCRREDCVMLAADATDLRHDQVPLVFAARDEPGGGPVAATPTFTG